jgi:hypothetical protein
MANTGDRGQEAGRNNPSLGQHSQGGQERRSEESSGGTLGAVKDRVRDMASNVAEKAGEAWDTTREHVSEWASTAGQGVQNAWEGVNGFFRRYPIPMFFAGIGLGFLLARALGGSSTNMTRRMSDYSAR